MLVRHRRWFLGAGLMLLLVVGFVAADLLSGRDRRAEGLCRKHDGDKYTRHAEVVRSSDAISVPGYEVQDLLCSHYEDSAVLHPIAVPLGRPRSTEGVLFGSEIYPHVTGSPDARAHAAHVLLHSREPQPEICHAALSDGVLHYCSASPKGPKGSCDVSPQNAFNCTDDGIAVDGRAVCAAHFGVERDSIQADVSELRGLLVLPSNHVRRPASSVTGPTAFVAIHGPGLRFANVRCQRRHKGHFVAHQLPIGISPAGDVVRGVALLSALRGSTDAIAALTLMHLHPASLDSNETGNDLVVGSSSTSGRTLEGQLCPLPGPALDEPSSTLRFHVLRGGEQGKTRERCEVSTRTWEGRCEPIAAETACSP